MCCVGMRGFVDAGEPNELKSINGGFLAQGELRNLIRSQKKPYLGHSSVIHA